MSAAKVRYWLLLEEATLAELRAEAQRLDRSLSRMIRFAWRLSTDARRALDAAALEAMKQRHLRRARAGWVGPWLGQRQNAEPRDGLCPQMFLFEGEDFAELCAIVGRSRVLPEELVAWAWRVARDRLAAMQDVSALDSTEPAGTQEVVDGRRILKTPPPDLEDPA